MKIVVRGTNWIGDAVMSVPALRTLRAAIPEAHIALHTRSWAEGIFRDAAFIDEILAYDQESMVGTIRRESARLKAERFDVSISLPNSFESAFLPAAARIKRRFGYNTDGRGFLLTDGNDVPDWKGSRHEAYYYDNLVRFAVSQLGQPVPESEIVPAAIEVSAVRRDEAKRLLDVQTSGYDRPYIGLGVGSTNSMAKRWGIIPYGDLCDMLYRQLDASVFLIGASNELDVSNAVAAKADCKPVILTGRTDLAQATAILSELDLFISNDMGLAHVAAAVGTKTIVIFGPTNSITTSPFSPAAEIISAGVECAPCMLRECPIDHRCMTRIESDSVFERARLKLNEPAN